MLKVATTRERILQKSFELIYENGYEATSVEDILASSEVDMDVLNHYFDTKETIGLAMIQDIIYPSLTEGILKPLANTLDVIEEIHGIMHTLLMDNSFFKVEQGCPAVNLIEEMALVNTNFHCSLSHMTMEWQVALKDALDRWKRLGRLNKDVDTAKVALFIISGYRGIRNTGKLYGTPCYDVYLQELKRYLYSLED